MPKILLENCTQCLKCVKDCPANAIDIKKGSIRDTCIHCGHCVAICPESTIEPDTGEIKPLQNSNLTSENFENFISGLRSVRYYLKKEIPEETILLLVENMKHYASASNSRPINITVVRSAEKIQLLNDAALDSIIKPLKLISLPIIRTFIQIFVPSINVKSLNRYKKSFIRKRKTNSSLVIHHAPAVMLFHAPVTKYGMADTDANIWATNTTIYAKTLGLGSCFIGFIVKAMERNKGLRKEMDIPKGHKVYAALILGYPKVKYKNETSRERPAVKFI
jgi:nitroreductase/NAD-dependent dihydropyrimidine dehydrogenase PreA subunit